MNAPTKKSGRGQPDRDFRPDPLEPFAPTPQSTETLGPKDSFSQHQKTDTQFSSRDAEKDRATGNLAQDTVNTARGLAQSVTSQASELASNVGQQLSATAEANIASGASALRGFAKAMETAARELETQSPQAARRVREAAGRMENFCDGVSNRKIGELLTAASDLARNQPTVFIAGAVLGGFAFARFLKSSGTGRPFPARQNEGEAGSSAESSQV